MGMGCSNDCEIQGVTLHNTGKKCCDAIKDVMSIATEDPNCEHHTAAECMNAALEMCSDCSGVDDANVKAMTAGARQRPALWPRLLTAWSKRPTACPRNWTTWCE